MDTAVPTAPDASADPDFVSAPPPTEIATHFPQLEIIELLGRGGMGWVYKARQTKLDRVVALKLLPPDRDGDPSFAERFQREARALARLNHPNIVAVFDFGQAGPYFYFVMEFVDGANLRQLERARRLSPEEAFAIVPKLCEALQYAHEEGIVHRDVKPENILIDSRGRLKIADFGIAKIVGKTEDITLTATQHALGTPQYMAPEQFETPGKVDHRADIYALGVVFYEMLTGELPMGRFEPPSSHVHVDVRMDEVVLKSLERNPDRRYQTASAVKSDVESISATGIGTSRLTAGGPAPTAAATGPLPPPTSAAVRADAPAFVLLLATFIIWAGIALLGCVVLYGFAPPHQSKSYMVLLVSLVVANAFATFGALRMMQGRSWEVGVAAAVLVMIIPILLIIAHPNPAMLLPLIGIPAGAWALVRHRRPGVKGAFAGQQQQPSQEPTRTPGLLSLLGMAGRDWWGDRAKWFTIGVQSVLAVLHLVCLFAFIGTRITSRWEDGGHRQFTYTLGAVDPWYTFETYPTADTPFRSGVQFTAGSMLFLVAGFAIYYIIWRIEKIRRPMAGFWSTPGAMGIIWALFAAAGVAMGMKLGHDTMKDDRLGGLLAPQLRSAMAIADVDEQDQALRKVALQATGAKDMRTVRRAIQEIRDSDLHDQTAADCALALLKLKDGAGDATAVAGDIRDTSLRDATLARTATTGAASTGSAADAQPSSKGELSREDLVAAAAQGNISRIVELLDAGVSVNDKNAAGQTALIQAIANGHRSLALTLILLGADLLEKDAKGMTAVMHAVERRDHAFLSTLPRLAVIASEPDSQKRKESLRALPGVDRALLQNREFDLVQFFAAHDALMQTDEAGETPSLKAARGGDWEAFLLVGNNLDSLRARGKDGRTAAMHFASAGVTTPFETLGESHLFGKAGAKVGFVGSMVAFDIDQLALADNAGKTALELAREHGHTEIADTLWRHLETLVAHETTEIEKISQGRLTTAELARESEQRLEATVGDEAARNAQVANDLLRSHYEIRSLAWQALGEEEKAKADFQRSKRPVEP